MDKEREAGAECHEDYVGVTWCNPFVEESAVKLLSPEARSGANDATEGKHVPGFLSRVVQEEKRDDESYGASDSSCNQL